MNSRRILSLAVMGSFAGLLTATMARSAEPTHEFSRYRVILDRAPFGAVAGNTAETPQPSFSSRFTFIGTTQEGVSPLTAVVLDKEGNRVHFVAEGDKIGAVTVTKIEKVDNAPTKLVLKQGLEVATLVLESKGGTGAPFAAGTPANAGQPGPGQPPAPATIQPGARRIPFRRGG